MRSRVRMLGFLAVFAGTSANAASVLPVYLEGANAPAPLVARVEDRLKFVMAERSMSVAALPDAPIPPDARIAAAKKDLEKGLAAYRGLQLDTAVPSLSAAEKAALAVPESVEAPKVLGEARIYLGIIAAATGSNADADKFFRLVAATDPDRRLDSKQFPPDTVAAYEKARKAIAAASFGEVALSSSVDGLSFFIDGRPAAGASVRLSYGEHLFLATGEAGSQGERFEVTEQKSVWRASPAPDVTRLVGALRVAAKRGDDAAIARAADALAAAAGAGRVLLWDLRSVGGRVEAPLRLREAGARGLSRVSVADLGTGASPDAALRSALLGLTAPDAAPAGTPVARGPDSRRPGGPRKGVGNWVWWTAGGIALLAAGGAAAALSSAPAGNDKVAVTVEH